MTKRIFVGAMRAKGARKHPKQIKTKRKRLKLKKEKSRYLNPKIYFVNRLCSRCLFSMVIVQQLPHRVLLRCPKCGIKKWRDIPK